MYYDNSAEILLIVLSLVFLFGFLMVMFHYTFPKSKRYRELLSDMYVVGMIKQIAEKDNVNLQEELKEFTRILRVSDIKYRNLDKVIEENLKTKVAEEQEKNLPKK